MLIRNAYLSSFDRPDRKPAVELRVSDLGYHPYKVMDRILNRNHEPFEPKILDKMACGEAYEADIVSRLIYNCGAKRYDAQFPLFNDIWNGYTDLILDHKTDFPRIVEFKGVDSTAFRFGNFPRSTNICQLWMYGELYLEKYGVKPKLTLYYRSWGQWAEFEIVETGGGYLVARGEVNDKPTEVDLRYRPHLLRQELEHFFTNKVMPDDSSGADTWNYAEDFESARS